MTFNSWEFLIFFPIVALLYYLLPKRARWPMLLIASYYFYMFYQASLVVLILVSTLVSWVASIIIERAHTRAVKLICLAVSLAVSLGILFFFKYFNFLFGSFAGIVTLLGGEPPRLVLELVLPVGISFYTFQTLSYVIDVYRGDVKCERNFFLYALFVSFFPQLVAGPIERPGNLIPQLRAEHKFTRGNFTRGSKLMILGFFKKICVADAIAPFVDSVYNSPAEADALGIVIATVLFAVQIYCDFSGYTDIATGCARIMGIRLMKNFDHPYSATSIKDFWSRWHISLSGWLRDYLYIPLGGSRRSRARTLLNILVVFLVSGLWHGASWTFVIWGAMHGVYRIAGTLTERPRAALLGRLGKSESSGSVKAVRRVLTFSLVTASWLFFRANSVADAGTLIAALFTRFVSIPETLSAMGLGFTELATVILSVATLFLLDRLVDYGECDGSDVLVRDGGFAKYLWVIMLVWLLLLSEGRESSFIYFQF